MESKKEMIQMNLSTSRIKLTDLENKLMVAMGEEWGKGIVREFEINITHCCF